jgi:propionate CoA-transferase
VSEVEHRTFSGKYANLRGQNVLYITERCVFRLVEEGLELTEVAPGVDIEKDIFAHMEFRPIVRNPVSMDPRIFLPETMGLREEMLRPHVFEEAVTEDTDAVNATEAVPAAAAK